LIQVWTWGADIDNVAFFREQGTGILAILTFLISPKEELGLAKEVLYDNSA